MITGLQEVGGNVSREVLLCHLKFHYWERRKERKNTEELNIISVIF
jgi:hypothetical protein